MRNWVECGKTAQQIRILAQLNCCTQQRIKSVIVAAGYEIDMETIIKSQDHYSCRRWTAADCRKVVDLRDKGLRWKDIAKLIGRSVESCRKHYYSQEMKDA